MEHANLPLPRETDSKLGARDDHRAPVFRRGIRYGMRAEGRWVSLLDEHSRRGIRGGVAGEGNDRPQEVVFNDHDGLAREGGEQRHAPRAAGGGVQGRGLSGGYETATQRTYPGREEKAAAWLTRGREPSRPRATMRGPVPTSEGASSIARSR